MRIANDIESFAGIHSGRERCATATDLEHVPTVKTSQNDLSMQSSFLRKGLFGLKTAITSPRSTLSWIVRGHLAKDQVFVSHTYWFTGTLPRVPLPGLLPGI